MRTLLDTSAYSALVRGHKDLLEVVRNSDHIVLSTVVLGELRAGFQKGSQARANERILRDFLQRPRVMTVAVDEETSVRYAQIKVRLMRAGTPIPANDVWIAASALQHGLELATLDRLFERVELAQVRLFEQP